MGVSGQYHTDTRQSSVCTTPFAFAFTARHRCDERLRVRAWLRAAASQPPGHETCGAHTPSFMLVGSCSMHAEGLQARAWWLAVVPVVSGYGGRTSD